MEGSSCGSRFGASQSMATAQCSLDWVPDWFNRSTDDDERSESVYSYQELETEYVQDTSDTCTKSDNDSSSVEEELELATSSSDDNKSDGSTSTGVSDEHLIKIVPIICMEDLGLLAGTSHSDGSTDAGDRDPEVPRADYWTCALCRASNNNPVYRYCEKCYQVRKSYYPPRPRPTDKRKHRQRNQNSQNSQNSQKQATNASSGELSSDSGKPAAKKARTTDLGLHSSQETIASSLRTSDSGLGSQVLDESTSSMCNSCDARPKDGVFVHNNSGHNWCCYVCAKKIWKRTNRCPVCNRTVMKVIKIFKV